MTEPLLHRAQVDTGPEATSRERRSELVQPEASEFSSARSATAFRSSRKFIFTLQPEVGKTKLQVLSDFAFRAFRLVDQLCRIGISRSLYAFGVQPRSGLWLTRTVEALEVDVRPGTCT